MDQNFLDAMFDKAMDLLIGKSKHWEEIEPGVWQVKKCYSEDTTNPSRLIIKLEGEDYLG